MAGALQCGFVTCGNVPVVIQRLSKRCSWNTMLGMNARFTVSAVLGSLTLMNGCTPASPNTSQTNELRRALPRAGPLGPKGYEVRSSKQALGSHGEITIDFTNLPLHGPRHPYTLELRFYSTLQAHPCVITNPEAYVVAVSVQSNHSSYEATYRLDQMGVTASPKKVRPSYVGDPFYYRPPLTMYPPGVWESSQATRSLLRLSVTRNCEADDVIGFDVTLRTGGTK